MNDPDAMFTPEGLATFLVTATDGGHRYRKTTGVTVDVAGHAIRIERDDLTCADCSGPIDPPRNRPAKFLALNQALNGGETRCLDCMDDQNTDDAVDAEQTEAVAD